ncbi:RdgB/HAM1 family non-canonical purine NTP pyrophosphatase [Haloarcula halophila]|uniref:RdgB/HAM1 family non-canonical purine NTP pyrophosphatase n=1 Tax=Haloarcula TaxID=2237 RepID=UPI0023E3A25E|nr:RdgB/HAM1 family non-canonical purine NTP pyrophosphatase [Halomicroarcula sp. DFY41]
MLNFVTTNPGKVREATAYLDDAVEQFDFDYPEIQADDLAAVAAHGARSAYRAADGPVVVDDAGLFVDAFDGFPGPYSSYVEDTVGVERVWRMTEPESDRSAAFKTVLAYCDGDPLSTDRVHEGGDDEPPVALFEGRVDGTIVAPRGDGGFGFDPIFEHDGATFAEMSTDEKNAVSHRGRALESFAGWYADR